MKRLLLAFLTLIALSPARAQYSVRSPYLLNPDLAIGYVDSCARFWRHAYDGVNGGYFTNIDRYGNVITAWGTNKNLQTQSRNAYGFVRAFMLTGDETYLTEADRALSFMYAHLWDTNSGGWYSAGDRFGNPTSPGGTKNTFDQHYGLLGPVARYEAMRDSIDLHWIGKGFGANEYRLWDTRPGYAGYYDAASYDWSSPSGKSFNATVDALTTHLLQLYQMTGGEPYRLRILDVVDNIQQRLVGSMNSQAMGFVEEYSSDWVPDDSPPRMTIMGHVLKTAWCLARVHQLFPDSALVTSARKLADHVWTKGYDHDFGGPYKDYDRVTGQMLMWGIPDTAKAWWQMEQAVTAGLQLYAITGDSSYLHMADETLQFFMTYFVDHVYGDVYSDRTRYGLQAWGNEKGNGNKAGYHSIELGYYVYVYGNLLLNARPATLHYRFAPNASDRWILLSPIAMAPGKLKIRDIRRGLTAYSDFDASACRIHLPQGEGGAFAVTFEVTPTTAVAAVQTLPEQFQLRQNYPNPFNPSTTIRFDLPRASEVSLIVYDMLGRQVAVLIQGPLAPGAHEVRFDGQGLASGMYVYRVVAGKESMTRRMLLLR